MNKKELFKRNIEFAYLYYIDVTFSICWSLCNCLYYNSILICNSTFNTTMFKLLFGVTQYDLLIQSYIKNGDSFKLSSLLVQMDYIIDSVINSHDIMKSY